VFQQHRVPYRVALELGGWEIIKQYVAMGMGISIISSICLAASDRQTLVMRPLDTVLPGVFSARSYGIITRKGKILSAPARAFVESVKSIEIAEK